MNAFSPPGWLTIRHVASGLLVTVVLLYVPARIYESLHPLVGYVRAFAEAAMVGALADWFAVTALFRRPLGLPIPHTAVIPRNQERIGTALGDFIERNFLVREALVTRLDSTDFTALIATWLEEDRHRAVVADHLTEIFARVVETVPDEEVRRVVFATLSERIRHFEVAPMTAEILGMLTSNDRHQLLIDEMLRQAAALLKDSEPLIRDKVSARTAWLWRKLSVDDRIASEILVATEEALTEITDDRGHPWRLRFDTTVRDFIQDLKTSQEYREKGEALKEELLRHPSLRAYVDGLWTEIRQGLRDDAQRPESRLRGSLREGLALVAERLLADAELRMRLNRWLGQVILEVVDARRREVSDLVAKTVQGWDPVTMTRKIELEIGDDLQYIRINGTVIGGLAGVGIHAVAQLFS